MSIPSFGLLLSGAENKVAMKTDDKNQNATVAMKTDDKNQNATVAMKTDDKNQAATLANALPDEVQKFKENLKFATPPMQSFNADKLNNLGNPLPPKGAGGSFDTGSSSPSTNSATTTV